MRNDKIAKLLVVPLSLSPYSSLDDFYLFQNEKLMSYSISLIIEIDELLEKGYSKEEIREMIEKSDYSSKDPSLTDDESNYLIGYSLRLLEIRNRLFLEKKDSEKGSKVKSFGSIDKK